MAHTTIPVDPRVRDRLRTYGIAGETYNDILTRLMDQASERGFVTDLQRRFDEIEDAEWVDLEALE